MSVTKTIISDVIVPEVFNPYVIERTAELSAFYQSGIIARNPELDRLASSGGKLVNMPFWEDLRGNSQVLSDVNALTVKKITGAKDVFTSRPPELANLSSSGFLAIIPL